MCKNNCNDCKCKYDDVMPAAWEHKKKHDKAIGDIRDYLLNGETGKTDEIATTRNNHSAIDIACAGWLLGGERTTTEYEHFLGSHDLPVVGGFLGGKPKMINVQIPEDLFNKVEAHAEESGLLTDDVIANALYCHFVELQVNPVNYKKLLKKYGEYVIWSDGEPFDGDDLDMCPIEFTSAEIDILKEL